MRWDALHCDSLRMALGISVLFGTSTVAQSQEVSISSQTLNGIVTNIWSESATSLSPIRQVSGEHFPLVLREDGSVYSTYTTPGGVLPRDLKPLKQIVAFDQVTMGLGFDSTVVTWGASPYDITPPAGLKNITFIDTDGRTFAALRSDGTVVCWGDNEFGQCTVPPGIPKVQEIAVAGNSVLLLLEDGTLKILGGQLPRWDTGLGKPVTEPSSFVHISADKASAVAIRKDGSGTILGWEPWADQPDLWRIEKLPKFPGIRELAPRAVAIAMLADGRTATRSRDTSSWELTETRVRSASGGWRVYDDGTVLGRRDIYGPLIGIADIAKATANTESNPFGPDHEGYGLDGEGKSYIYPEGTQVPMPAKVDYTFEQRQGDGLANFAGLRHSATKGLTEGCVGCRRRLLRGDSAVGACSNMAD